jgi:HlyD family secretion protein
MTAPTPRRNILPIVIVLIAAAALAWGGWRDGGWFRAEAALEEAGYKVQRQHVDITVSQRGNLSARNAAKVYSELEGRAAILEIVDEGAVVEVGDVLVRLDSSALEDRKVAQDIAVQNARAALTKSEQNLQIQESQNTSDKAAAEQKLDFAKTDLRKYLEGDYPKKKLEAEEAIKLAEQEMAQAADKLFWSQQLFDQEFLTRSELETDKLAATRAAIKKEQATRTMALLEDFDHPKEERRLEAAVEEAVRELDRVKLQASAKLVDITADVGTNKAKLGLETEKFTKLNDQIAKATIRAPVAGYVVYRRSEGGMGRGSETIQKGTEIQERQEIMSIPQAGGMIAEASIHESVVQKVRAGMPVRLKVDAIPAREFNGEIGFIALVPDSNSWWANPNMRQFKTTVLILDPNSEMKPGMSCNVDILVDSIDNALAVPVQAVYRSGGSTICFINGKAVPVKIGRSSDTWVEILEGLTEGQTVAMAPPTGFKPEPEPQREEDLAPPLPAMPAFTPPQGGESKREGAPAGGNAGPGQGGGRSRPSGTGRPESGSGNDGR